MKLNAMRCPSCGGPIKTNIQGRSHVFCTYCGQQILLDDERVVKTVNINKTVHKRYTDDAEIIKEINKDKKDKRSWIFIILLFVLSFAIAIIPNLIIMYNERSAVEDGKISAGFYRDLIGEDYKTVEAHFEAAGFTDIELIETDVSVLDFSDGKVKTISIGGNTRFDSTDYFEPDTKVVISYH